MTRCEGSSDRNAAGTGFSTPFPAQIRRILTHFGHYKLYVEVLHSYLLKRHSILVAGQHSAEQRSISAIQQNVIIFVTTASYFGGYAATFVLPHAI